MKVIQVIWLIFCFIILCPYRVFSNEKIFLGRKGTKTFLAQSDFLSSNTTYIINGVCDLSGKTVKIPENSGIDTSKGELNGGTIVLSDGVKLVNNHTKNLNVYTKGFFSNEKIYIDNKKYATSHFQSVLTNIELLCDINLGTRSSGITLNGNLNGNGHTLEISGKSYDLLYLDKDNITIKNVILSNNTINPQSACRIILCRASHINIVDCTLKGAMVFAPATDSNRILRNISINNNKIECDFSSLAQGYGFQHDVFTFRACKDVLVKSNIIKARDVNRVFKTARAWEVKGKAKSIERARPCVENITIENNEIISYASCGKQFWDMYNGTINSKFINNKVKCFGHTVMFENKTKDNNGVQSTTLIEGNSIETDWKLLFVNSNIDNDAYIIRNNDVIISGKEREHEDLVGQKKSRNYVNSFAGFSSLIFERNIIRGRDAGIGLYPFIFQLEGGDIKIYNNSLMNLGTTLLVNSAVVKSIDFNNNVYVPINEFDCDISISGKVNKIIYQNSQGASFTSVRMTKESYEFCSDIEIVAPKGRNKLVLKDGQSFGKNQIKFVKRNRLNIK